jgi:hypothetical protein
MYLVHGLNDQDNIKAPFSTDSTRWILTLGIATLAVVVNILLVLGSKRVAPSVVVVV